MPDTPGFLEEPVRIAVPVRPAESGGLAGLRALTLNHRELGVQALQEASLDAGAARRLHDALTAAGIPSLVLVTCNRTEVYWHASGPADDAAVDAACAAVPDAPRSWAAATRLAGAPVARNLFRVCAGLESLVPGEAEILGQVRSALDGCPGAGPFLRGVVQGALRAGRMARAETAIGVGAQSVASAAVHLVASALPLGQARVVVLGAGATGVKVATHLRSLGVTDLVVVNRSEARAREVAAAVGGEAAPLARLGDELRIADAVVCAVHAPTPVVSLADLTAIAADRRRRPLIIADISMPPAVAPGHVAGVTRVDLAAVEAFVARQRDSRVAEVPRVEAILAREMRHLETWVRRHTLRPIVSGLRRKVDAIRRAELARIQQELPGTTAVDSAILERLSRRLLEQVLAVPLASLETGALPLDEAQADYLARLFALDREADA
jgi:glutamyl-tRNA reductase